MLALLKRHLPQLIVLLVLIVVPLIGFASIAEDVYEREPFPWESPLIRGLRGSAGPVFQKVAVFLSFVGSARIMAPLSLLVLFLFWRKSRLAAGFFALAMGGALGINVLFKTLFHRARPTEVIRILEEKDFSFPSGHAMYSMALVVTLAVLLFRTRWHLVIEVAGGIYCVLMGLSRIYVGVHYPTDVLAGWAVSLSWVVGLAMIFWPHLHVAQREAAAPETPPSRSETAPPGSASLTK